MHKPELGKLPLKALTTLLSMANYFDPRLAINFDPPYVA